MASFNISTDVTVKQTLTGSEGGIVSQNGSISVLGDYAITTAGDNDLIINGTVSSTFDAISATGDVLNLIIGSQGNVLASGAYGLISSLSAWTSVQNNGTIGGASTGLGLFASDSTVAHTVLNTGSIAGDSVGIQIEARGSASTIINSGFITSGGYGIIGNFITDAVLEVWNTGTIAGKFESFRGNSDDGSGTSSDRVHNAGLMTGNVILLGGDDLYDGIGGFVAGIVDGGAGSDTLIGGTDTDIFLGGTQADLLRGRGGDDDLGGDGGNDTILGGGGNDDISGDGGEDRLFGGDGSDTLSGGLNDDVIRGDDGNDEITGGSGADRLIGGAGADTFIYTAAAQSPFGGDIDVIRDFTSGEDQIDLSDIVGPDLVFIGTAGFSGTQGEVRYFTNAKGNASVFADVDGDGVADLRIFLVNVQSLDQGDFVL